MSANETEAGVGNAVCAIVLAVPLWLGAAWIRAWAILTLAAWFVVPMFPVRLPSYPVVMGLFLFVTLWRPHAGRKNDSKGSPLGDLVRCSVESVLFSAITVGIARVVLALWGTP